MRFNTLQEWLDWQLLLHFRSIDLGLERVSTVANRLGINKVANQVITVAGTNGKGSTVTSYETWLYNAGYSVASYTSPHLLQYNERIKINHKMATDSMLCTAFEAIDQARGDISLSYFEFGTLAALWLMQQENLDFAVLEVGLGGRLDAVNIIDADMVHLTSIGIDHQSWLGDTREKIGFEKAGVLREGIPVICNDSEPPQSVLDAISRLNCSSLQYKRDFDIQATTTLGCYVWKGLNVEFNLTPVLPGVHQVQNLAGVVAGLHLLLGVSQVSAVNVDKNFAGTELIGRFQKVETPLSANVYVDVGHNHDAAKVLAKNLLLLKPETGRLIVLLGMLEDKDSINFVLELNKVVDDWWLLTLDCDRGLSAEKLEQRIANCVSVDERFETVEHSLEHAMSSLTNQDIILVTGSFVTVELFLRATSRTNTS
ncbi:MAG: dihydrofolate synthase/folylpolyglutamate synthase [Gammaproteobacteria bacterium]|jgi:dihydrofolate synthase/folylpolyglutamate synthase